MANSSDINFNNDMDATQTAAASTPTSGLKTGFTIAGGVIALEGACHLTNRVIDSGYNKAASKLETWWNAKPESPKGDQQPGK